VARGNAVRAVVSQGSNIDDRYGISQPPGICGWVQVQIFRFPIDELALAARIADCTVLTNGRALQAGLRVQELKMNISNCRLAAAAFLARRSRTPSLSAMGCTKPSTSSRSWHLSHDRD